MTALAHRISIATEVGFDTESYGPPLVHKKKKKGEKTVMINVYASTCAGFSVAFDDGEAFYVPLGHKKRNCPRGNIHVVFDALRHCRVWAHNWKYDLKVVRGLGFPMDDYDLADSAILYWLKSSPDAEGKYGLKGLAKKYLGVDAPTFEGTVGDIAMFGALDPKDKKVVDYACHDARNTLKLASKALPLPEGFQLEMDFTRALCRLEDAGMGIDSQGLENLYRHAESERSSVMSEWGIMMPEVSISSPAQMKAALVPDIWSPDGLEVTKEGNLSLNAESLKTLELRHRSEPDSLAYRLVDVKMQYQDVQKIVSTYSWKLIDQAAQNPDGRIHGSYHQTGTATGRLSCSDPNLQNIPTRSDYGRLVKAQFIPRPGYKLVTADYSQVELRVMAHYCGEGILFDAYSAGLDVHQAMADRIGTSRFNAKTVNFATLYGAGTKKIAKACGISNAEAAKILKNFYDSQPEVTAKKKQFVQDAERNGGATTFLGRFRPIPELESTSGEKWRGERLAVNTPIQGGAADIVKLAMVNIDKELPSDWYMISQVHDELTLEIPEKDVDSASRFIQDKMEGAFKLKVPLVAEPSSGSNWAECK